MSLGSQILDTGQDSSSRKCCLKVSISAITLRKSDMHSDIKQVFLLQLFIAYILLILAFPIPVEKTVVS